MAENYPDLKANQNFLDLQKQLADTENQISFARQYYNDAVATLNKLVRTIPWMFFTGIAGVHQREFYDAPAGPGAGAAGPLLRIRHRHPARPSAVSPAHVHRGYGRLSSRTPARNRP